MQNSEISSQIFNKDKISRDFIVELMMVMQESSDRPFDLAAVPRDVKQQLKVEKKAPTSKEKKAAKDASQKAAADGAVADGAYERLLNAIPQFAGFGKLFKVLCL
jgi:coatomer protein complex subunit gamma